MKRVVNNLLSLNNLRKFCGNAAVFKFAKNSFKLEILDKPKKGRVLVLAPHPDDDVFGCGGSIALHARQGDQVKVIYLAGNIANKFLISNSKFLIKEGGAINRKKEAENAAKVLKIADIEFWGLGDNKFTAGKRNVARLKRVIDEYQPKIIYCPSFTDSNPDHFEVSKMLYSVIARSQQATKQSISGSQIKSGMTSECQIAAPSDKSEWLAMTNILLYEVWTPIFVNRLVKIDSVIKQKKAAIKCHSSQLADRSYLDAIIGLNQYRAGMFNVGKYAEGFWEMDAKVCLKLFDLFCLKP